MNRWKEFSTKANLSRSLMNSLMVPAVIGAVLWKFYEVITVSFTLNSPFLYTMINSFVFERPDQK